MKSSFLYVLLFFISMNVYSQNLSTKMDTVSYSVGVLVGKNLQQQGMDDLNLEEFAAAVSDVFNSQTKIDDDKAQALFQGYMKEKSAQQFSAIKSEGENFLAKNAERPEVKTTESGLQYEVITPGTGAQPSATSNVTVHYHGSLIDGKVFDSSVNRGQPASFPVNGVIQGWQEALPMMKTGAKWKLYIPYNLAYGERGAGNDIQPYSALIFDVELLEIN